MMEHFTCKSKTTKFDFKGLNSSEYSVTMSKNPESAINTINRRKQTTQLKIKNQRREKYYSISNTQKFKHLAV